MPAPPSSPTLRTGVTVAEPVGSMPRRSCHRWRLSAGTQGVQHGILARQQIGPARIEPVLGGTLWHFGQCRLQHGLWERSSSGAPSQRKT